MIVCLNSELCIFQNSSAVAVPNQTVCCFSFMMEAKSGKLWLFGKVPYYWHENGGTATIIALPRLISNLLELLLRAWGAKSDQNTLVVYSFSLPPLRTGAGANATKMVFFFVGAFGLVVWCSTCILGSRVRIHFSGAPVLERSTHMSSENGSCFKRLRLYGHCSDYPSG